MNQITMRTKLVRKYAGENITLQPPTFSGYCLLLVPVITRILISEDSSVVGTAAKAICSCLRSFGSMWTILISFNIWQASSALPLFNKNRGLSACQNKSPECRQRANACVIPPAKIWNDSVPVQIVTHHNPSEQSRIYCTNHPT